MQAKQLRGAKAPCLIHGHKCSIAWEDPPSGPRPCTLGVWGPMCTPWCQPGQRSGTSHSAMESFYIWQEQIKRWRLDINIVENSPLFPVKDFAAEVKTADQLFVYIVFGPEDR